MKTRRLSQRILFHPSLSYKQSSLLKTKVIGLRKSVHTMSEAKEFPPRRVREVVGEVARLLRERGESVSVAETVWVFLFLFVFCLWCFGILGGNCGCGVV